MLSAEGNMHKPNTKYRVTLTEEERGFLQKPIKKGKTAGCRIRHAQPLLALDGMPENKAWTDEKTGKAYGSHVRTVGNLRKRFAEKGFGAASERKKRDVPPAIKTDGEAEAKITALTRSGPPEGRCRRTLQLSAGKAAEPGILDGISHTAVGNPLKKTALSHGRINSGVWQRRPPTGDVRRTEGVLETRKLPHGEQRPAVCLDEANRQLVEETQAPRPVRPGQAALYDFEHIRNGAANLFMVFGPLAHRREVIVTVQRTMQDFARCLRHLAIAVHPLAEKIILAADNLNAHTLASLHAAFDPETARRLCERFGFHYTPKHGPWLNTAGLEIGVMSRQCLDRRMPAMEKMHSEVQAWAKRRNNNNAAVRRQFTTADARIKPQRPYTQI
jgi:hypothetical protein